MLFDIDTELRWYEAIIIFNLIKPGAGGLFQNHIKVFNILFANNL